MPSKRKKNKRRMRRVQAQRRLLEEQHAACPPVKASPALVVGAPGTAPKKQLKSPSQSPHRGCKSTKSVLKQTPVEVEIPEVPAPVITEEQVIQAEVPVAAPAEIQTHGVFEPEPQVEAQITTFIEEVTVGNNEKEEPITEQAEEPLETIETTEAVEIATVAVTNVEADTAEENSQSDESDEDQSEGRCSVEVTVDETESKDGKVINKVTEPNVEEESPQTEEHNKEDEEPEPVEEVAEPEVVMQVVECVESEPVDEEEEEESYSSDEEEEDNCEMEVLSEETSAETNHITQDTLSNGELPVESDALTLPPLTEALEPITQTEISVDTADVMVDDFVVTDTSAEVIESKTIELLPTFDKPTVAVCEILGLGPTKINSEPELITSAENMHTDDAAESLETCSMEEASLTNTSANIFVGTEWMKQTQEVSSLEM
ncbi:hypothetical protein WMY93_005267 [Mugilogobius chulae]|uniref:Uncharacterized protein n=1 Tax=Mugilogobius chulae TaxID=88201 RepID=A0AAW0Q0N2_9GOBI